MATFRLIFAPFFENHLAFIEPKYHSLIKNAIIRQLLHEPIRLTKNRKPLKKAISGGSWEIRFGPKNSLRVFYQVDEKMETVNILAVGFKQGNKLFIEGMEVI